MVWWLGLPLTALPGTLSPRGRGFSLWRASLYNSPAM